MRDHIEFFRQFRRRFETTGSVAPSSRFLAAAITRPLTQREGPARILEVGPGTGAFTRRIVQLVQPGDEFHLVELNESFATILRDRFTSDPDWRRVADQSQVYECPLQEFETDGHYDFIISGLPLNNFPADLVRDIYETMFRLLAPDGVLSYFEYMYVRPIRRVFSKPDERRRLLELDEIANSYQDRYRVGRDSVLLNFPPAWAQHLRNRQTADRETTDQETPAPA